MYGEKRIYDIFFRIVISNTIGYSGIRQTELPFKTGILREFKESLKINSGKNYPKNLTHFFVLAKVIRDL